MIRIFEKLARNGVEEHARPEKARAMVKGHIDKVQAQCRPAGSGESSLEALMRPTDSPVDSTPINVLVTGRISSLPKVSIQLKRYTSTVKLSKGCVPERIDPCRHLVPD